MAFDGDYLLNETGMPPGYAKYVYHTTDEQVTVEAAGYFNNKDDNLQLAKGDRITVFTWTTAVLTGSVSKIGEFVVTNVIANDAAASAGNVNVAEYGVSSAGALSSLA
ncbi:hypothetical protein [Roseibium sp.]|uniref:hypothetical protein n=1 Tax=Roseibium sp. TaxID=1936156 RepID=UPI003D0DEFFC